MNKLLKYSFLILGLFFISSTTAFSQSFTEGDAVVNAGIGLGSTYSYAGLGIPLGGGFEYGVTNLETGSIGVGGDLGFISGSGLTITYIGAKGSYHFNELFEIEEEEFDLYGGIGIYYRNFSYDGFGSNWGSGVIAGFHAGGRYYFSDDLGVYAEIGNNWAWLNGGIIFKL